MLKVEEQQEEHVAKRQKTEGGRNDRETLSNITNKGQPSEESSSSSASTAQPTIKKRKLEFESKHESIIAAASDTSSALLTWELDEKDNPRYPTEYIDDIYRFLRGVENLHAPAADYLDHQPQINERMRTMLFDWLMTIHATFRLRPETLYITFGIIDRFLSKNTAKRDEFQLLGCTAMLLACKVEEVDEPLMEDFVFISDRNFTRNDMLEMESKVLNGISFRLTFPTAYRFLRRFLKMAGAIDRISHISFYVMELFTLTMNMLEHPPSKVAASALYIALTKTGSPWTSTLQNCTHYTEADLKGCVIQMVQMVKEPNEREHAVTKKYSSSKFGGSVVGFLL